MMEEKCPFLYDDYMCSIPEHGECCPEAYDFRNTDGSPAECDHQMVVLTCAEAKALHMFILGMGFGFVPTFAAESSALAAVSAFDKLRGVTCREHGIEDNP